MATKENKSIGTDPHVRFLIENFDSIQNIERVTETAKERISKEVDREICLAIKEMDYFRKNGMVKETNDEGIAWWNPDLFDVEENIGPVFGFDFSQNWWSWLDKQRIDKEKIGVLYFFIETGDLGKTKARNKVSDWQKQIALHSKLIEAASNNILSISIIKTVDPEWPYIITGDINEIIAMPNLQNQGSFHAKIQDAFITFTDVILSQLNVGHKITGKQSV
jgi:hypothetical protein